MAMMNLSAFYPSYSNYNTDFHASDDFFTNGSRYYLTSELNQRLSLIRHLIQNSEQLLMVLAGAGYGKTSLLNQLKKVARKQCEHWWIYNPISNHVLSPEALMSSLLIAFNVRQQGKSPQVLQDSLRSHIAATRYNGQLPVLLIDDAHLLPSSTLKFIIELAIRGEPLTRMRVVLFGEPKIADRLATAEFEMVQKTLLHTIDLSVFSPTQVRDYLQFRLQGSKYNTIHPFTSEVIKQIYADSQGVVGKVNFAAQRIFNQFLEQGVPFSPLANTFSFQWFWGIPTIFILVGVIFLSYRMYLAIPETPALSLSQPPAFEESVTAPSQSSSLYEEMENIVSTYASEETSSPKLASKSTHSVDTTLRHESEFTKTPNSIVNTVPKPKTLSVVQSVPKKLENWLHRQNPKAYTLQLMGAYDQKTLKKFAKEQGVEDAVLVKTVYNQKAWYVLLYGTYSNRSQAQQALEQLPISLKQSTQPWARSFASIHKLVAELK
jgi:DamX protein